MGKVDEEQGTWYLRAMVQVLIGAVIAAVVSLLILFVCATLISRGTLSRDHTGVMSVCACVAGSLVGGLTAVTRCKSRSLIVGLLTGLVLFLLLLTVGLAVYHSVAIEEGGLPLGCGCLCGGALAGLFGARPKKKRRK